ncbi:MAG: cation-translocating P-type ATPase [Coriobacteriales bacterium]|nr:cation-translocating P-type ATPase [Coriobacteriales bacterium]
MSATVERVGGVKHADLNFASGTLLIEYDLAADPRAAVVKAVESTGHGLVPLDQPAESEDIPARSFLDRYRAEIAAIGGVLFAALGAALELADAPSRLSILAFAISILFGGLLVWRRALVSLRARRLDMNVLMSVAVFGAAAIGEWGEAATVFFLFSLGGLLEARSLERTRRSIRDLMDLTPPTARIVRGGQTIEVQLDEVTIGETVIVRPGERVPLDAVVSEGSSALDEAPITGESVPVDKQVGDALFAGSLNTTGLLRAVVSSTAADSTLARIVFMVEEAQASRAPSQRLVDRFSAYYTPIVVVLAALIAVIPPLVGIAFGLPTGGFVEWVQRALVMLVVACPCALVISTPVSIVSAITRASRDGVLVKGGTFLETAARVRAVAFDKTGTLTVGKPRVAQVLALDGTTPEALLGIAAVLEAHSVHPIARAVVTAAGDSVPSGSVQDFTDVPGHGVRGVYGGTSWMLGSPAVAEGEGFLTPEAAKAVASQEESGRTALVLVGDAEARAVIGVADMIRDEAPAAVGKLGRLGVEHTIMLTGDNERTAEAVASAVGVNSFLARLLPAGKTDAIRVLKERYGAVAMVGDGVNDAPALAASDIGIAMGAAGSDTALETADVALMRDDLTALPGFIALGGRTVNIIWQNVIFSIAVKFVVLALAVVGVATLWMAVFADTGVSLLVILNGMRLLRRKNT